MGKKTLYDDRTLNVQWSYNDRTRLVRSSLFYDPAHRSYDDRTIIVQPSLNNDHRTMIIRSLYDDRTIVVVYIYFYVLAHRSCDDRTSIVQASLNKDGFTIIVLSSYNDRTIIVVWVRYIVSAQVRTRRVRASIPCRGVVTLYLLNAWSAKKEGAALRKNSAQNNNDCTSIVKVNECSTVMSEPLWECMGYGPWMRYGDVL